MELRRSGPMVIRSSRGRCWCRMVFSSVPVFCSEGDDRRRSSFDPQRGVGLDQTPLRETTTRRRSLRTSPTVARRDAVDATSIRSRLGQITAGTGPDRSTSHASAAGVRRVRARRPSVNVGSVTNPVGWTDATDARRTGRGLLQPWAPTAVAIRLQCTPGPCGPACSPAGVGVPPMKSSQCRRTGAHRSSNAVARR